MSHFWQRSIAVKIDGTPLMTVLLLQVSTVRYVPESASAPVEN